MGMIQNMLPRLNARYNAPKRSTYARSHPVHNTQTSQRFVLGSATLQSSSMLDSVPTLKGSATNFRLAVEVPQRLLCKINA